MPGKSFKIAAIAALLVVPLSTTAQQLTYVVSYQGLLTAGVEIEIARAYLHLSDTELNGTVSTEGHDTAEFLVPIRFCYRARLDAEHQATAESEWWSRVGKRVSRGKLEFNRETEQIIRRHAEHKLDSDEAPKNGIDDFAEVAARPVVSDQDWDEAPFPPGTGPMDRLSMIQWLRKQPLEVGKVLEPAVSNGRKLTGYRVEVEGEEDLEWNGSIQPTWRIRLEPVSSDDKYTDPTQLWLTRDERRLPLLLSTARALGSFESRLTTHENGWNGKCEVPQANELVLPIRP